MDERIERAGQLYDRAVFSGDASGLDQAGRELDAAEAELALARGKLAHLSFLLQRGEGEALFWVGCCHQVVRRDNAAAGPALTRSLELASRAGDRPTMSEALRHLGIEAHFGGRPDEARQRLEESSRLRRELGSPAGVASNQIGLAYIAAARGRRADAQALLTEAAALAGASGAERVLSSVREAQAELGLRA